MPRARASAGKRVPRILLRGSWKSVNIGDVGHTPGALRLFERYFPEAEITLWPGRLEHGSRELLLKWFPRLRIADGTIDEQGRPTTRELAAAWEWADFLVHGSASGFGARPHVDAWHRLTGRSYGAFGISTDPISGFGPGRLVEGGTLDDLTAKIGQLPHNHLDRAERSSIDHAAFIFCRETLSRDYMRRQNVQTPLVEFGPDSTFAIPLRDDARADTYLRTAGIEPGRFIGVVPRLRYTPYHAMSGTPATADDKVRDAINARGVELDHARLRALITTWVRSTGLKVLTCPEMTYQVELAKKMLVDPLPADVRRHVVWRDQYWMPDEAAAIYAQARTIVSMECHSPIIALANGTPAIYVRQPTDTIKGQMYRDIGASDWVLEVDQTAGDKLWACVEKIHRDPEQARARVQEIMIGVAAQQRKMVEAVRQAVAAA